MGNPNALDGWSFTWEHGRELATMSNGTTTWTNTYNADGLRTKRTDGATTYSYVYTGSTLLSMTVGNDILYFNYDAAGTPLTVTYNGTTYYYATNLQGDVVAILDSTGATVVSYTYDAWGNPLTTTGSLATTLGQHNPLRYRGYVYDTETGLYYLQTRYYNPEICRFLNADGYTSTGTGLLGRNMFSYCNNSPIVLVDGAGSRPVVGASLEHETADDRELSGEYMRELSNRKALRRSPRAIKHNGDNASSYEDESDASVIARMLYGEDHNAINAHLWVLENRRLAGNYMGDDFRSLILAKNQFSAMKGPRALDPASNFSNYGEREAWEQCVDAAYEYVDRGIDAIAKPSPDFTYTYTRKYSQSFAEKYPNGVKIGGTWFYNK